MAVEIKSTYEGNLRVINIHSPSGSQLETDAPLDNCGKGERFSPTDLLVTSLASCIVTTMAIVAQKENLDFGLVQCRAEKHMSDPDTKPRKIAKIILEFTMPASINPEHRARLESIATNCPVHHSLANDVLREISFSYE